MFFSQPCSCFCCYEATTKSKRRRNAGPKRYRTESFCKSVVLLICFHEVVRTPVTFSSCCRCAVAAATGPRGARTGGLRPRRSFHPEVAQQGRQGPCTLQGRAWTVRHTRQAARSLQQHVRPARPRNATENVDLLCCVARSNQHTAQPTHQHIHR